MVVTLLYSSNFFVIGDGIQLTPEVFKEAGNVPAVGQGVVAVSYTHLLLTTPVCMNLPPLFFWTSVTVNSAPEAVRMLSLIHI